MQSTKKIRVIVTGLAALAMATSLAACSSNSGTGATTSAPAAAPTTTAAAAPTTTAAAAPTTAATSSAPAVTLTVWHNSTNGVDGPAFWDKVAKDFMAANPGVTVNVVGVQNEDFDGKLQTAMQANTAPDVFLQRGGGKMADQVAAGMVADITNSIDPTVKQQIGGGFAIETIDGKIYAMPMTIQPEGFWYSKDLFTKAGVDATTIKTLTDLNAAVVKLRDSGVYPIAVGAKDAWPAAHWFYQFVLRQCSQDEIIGMAKGGMKDPCWLAALQSLSDFNKTNPWNDGFLTTPAQQGASSSAGLVANHLAGMELMGAWNVGVIGSLTPDAKPLPDLGFFPFPNIDGGKGGAGALMAGADGWSCSAKAPQPACSNFLNFLGQTEQQKAFATALKQIPANPTAASAVEDPALKAAAEALGNSPYTLLWLDSALGQDAGNAVNQAVVALLAGQADPAAALAMMQAALG